MYQPNDVMLKMPPLKASFSGIVLPLVAMVAVTNNVIVPSSLRQYQEKC